jgi:hypothetical protein
MNAQISITLLAAAAMLGAGCTTDPQTRQRDRGAAIGAGTGAVVGGVIGERSDRVSTVGGAAVGAVAGGLAGAAIGHRADQRDAEAAYGVGDAGMRVQSIPPTPVSEPQETVPPQPAANAVWIRGHYVWTGNDYQWQPGRWEIPPPGATTYVQPTWQQAPEGGYVYARGHWQ